MADINIEFTSDELFLLEMALDEVLWRLTDSSNPTYQRYQLLEQKIYAARFTLKKYANDEHIYDSYDKPIEDLDFSVRTYNILKRAGINTFGELVKFNRDQLMGIRNMTKTAYREIDRKLFSLGYKPVDDVSEDAEF